jgi:hypothetical protein
MAPQTLLIGLAVGLSFDGLLIAGIAYEPRWTLAAAAALILMVGWRARTQPLASRAVWPGGKRVP